MLNKDVRVQYNY